jgi:hypothetical protein
VAKLVGLLLSQKRNSSSHADAPAFGAPGVPFSRFKMGVVLDLPAQCRRNQLAFQELTEP